MRDLVGNAIGILLRQAADNAGKDGKAARANGVFVLTRDRFALLAFLEHEVHTQANAQKGNAAFDGLANDIHLTELAHSLSCIRKSTDTRKNDGIRSRNSRRVVGDEGVATCGDEAALDALQISLVIVNNSNQVESLSKTCRSFERTA